MNDYEQLQLQLEQLSKQIENLKAELHTNTILNRVTLDLLARHMTNFHQDKSNMDLAAIIVELMAKRTDQVLNGASMLDHDYYNP